MNKPITIKRDELRSSLVTIINHTDLPAVLMIDILDDLRETLKNLQYQQEDAERKEWQKQNQKIPQGENSENQNKEEKNE